jgi:MFS family permease
MMTMKQLDVPVRQWVPDWLGMICIFFIILPVTMLNGSYTGSMLEVSSTLGTNTEDITMGYYAASAGMAIAYPIVPKVLDALSSKFLPLTDLSIQFLLSWVCARSQNIDLVIICSFFIGFLKGFLMLWFIRRATKIFSPKNVRSEFYSYFYPLVFAGGQVSMIVTAELAYHYNWQYMYYFMMMMLMASILIVIVCFRHNRPLKPIRLSELHIREMLVIATGLLMLMYVINYGKVLDWTSSFKIRIYLVIAPILIAFFIWKQYHSKHLVCAFRRNREIQYSEKGCKATHASGYQKAETPALPAEPPEADECSQCISRQQIDVKLVRVCTVHLQNAGHIIGQQGGGGTEKHDQHHVEVTYDGFWLVQWS